MMHRHNALSIVLRSLMTLSLLAVQQSSSQPREGEILQQGKVQTYTLSSSSLLMSFAIQPNNNPYISVFLNELACHIEISFLDNNKPISCLEAAQTRFACTFESSSSHSYRVEVSAEKGKQAIFTIAYKTAKQQCFAGKLNQPIYVTLPALAAYCFQFSIQREIGLVFQAALTHLQQLERHVRTTLLINQKTLSAGDTIHKVITTNDIDATCGLNNNTKPCMLTVSFLNTAQSSISLSFVLEEEDAEIALFDGINEHVRDEGPWSANARYFYYPVSSSKLIQIFFITRSLRSHSFLAAQFVTKAKFLSRLQMEDVYPPYVQEVDRVERNGSANYYSIVLGSVPFARVAISSDEVNGNCPHLDCFLLISIFPEYFKDGITTEYDEYDIEVSQQETSLSLGESKLGILNKDEYLTYLIEPEDAVIEFQAIDRQGKSAFCLSAAAALADGTIIKTNQFRSDLQLLKAQQAQRIFLRGEKDECTYQVKYLSNNNPLQTVQLSHPYQLALSSSQISRFIHYHQHPTSLRVVHLVTSGDVEVRVLPLINNNFTLSQLAKVPLASFPIFTNAQSELIINSSHPSFCSSCYYLIAVTTPNKFIGQILFLRVNDPIPLSSNHILKAWLTGQLPVQTYIFHSLSTFELTFNIASGQLEVVITDPREETVIRESIKEKRTFRVEALEYQGSVQLYSEQSRFTVRVRAVSSAVFYVEINRIHLTERIFQGYPSRIKIGSSMTPSVQFISSEQSSSTLTLIVNLEQTQATLNFTATAQGKKGLIASDQIIRSITRSSRTYTLTLNNLPARYFIAIKTSTPINATILLAKTTLTFLSPAQDYLFNADGIYHISSNSKRASVEVCSCLGDFSVSGSHLLEDLNNQTRVIAFDDFPGRGLKIFSILANTSYFLKVFSSSKNADLEYLIRYDYSQTNPYDSINSEASLITYESVPEGLTISMKQVAIGKPWRIAKVQYEVFASNSKSDLHRYSRCAIPANVTHKQSQNSTFLLQNKLLDGFHNLTIYLTGRTTITLANVTRPLTILFNIVQIHPPTQQTKHVAAYQYWLTDDIFVFSLYLLTFCVFCVVAPYWLVALCLRRRARRQQDMVEERPERIGTEQEIAGQSDLPETANKMIKEHI